MTIPMFKLPWTNIVSVLLLSTFQYQPSAALTIFYQTTQPSLVSPAPTRSMGDNGSAHYTAPTLLQQSPPSSTNQVDLEALFLPVDDPALQTEIKHPPREQLFDEEDLRDFSGDGRPSNSIIDETDRYYYEKLFHYIVPNNKLIDFSTAFASGGSGGTMADFAAAASQNVGTASPPWKIGDQIRTGLCIADLFTNLFLLVLLIIQSNDGCCCLFKSVTLPSNSQNGNNKGGNTGNPAINAGALCFGLSCWCYRKGGGNSNNANEASSTSITATRQSRVPLPHLAALTVSPSVPALMPASLTLSHQLSRTATSSSFFVQRSSCQRRCYSQTNRNSNNKDSNNRRSFLQTSFLASLSMANIVAGLGVLSRVLLPHYLGAPYYLCNDIPKLICLKIANLLILFSLAGCSIDHCLAVLWPLFHRTRSHLLANVYLLFTIAMWIAVILLISLEFIMPITVLQKCQDHERKAGTLVMLSTYRNLRDFCSMVYCHYNYAREIIQFAVWLFIAALILLCYLRLMIFLLGHRRRLVKSQSSSTYFLREDRRVLNNRTALSMDSQLKSGNNPSNSNKNSTKTHDPSVFHLLGLQRSSSVAVASALQRCDSSSISHASMLNSRQGSEMTPLSSLNKFSSTNNNASSTLSFNNRNQKNSGSGGGAKARHPLKGVLLTVGIIAAFAMIWLPHMIAEVVSSFVEYQGDSNSGQGINTNDEDESIDILHSIMSVTEILLLCYCCVLPTVYGVNVLFLARRQLGKQRLIRRSSSCSTAACKISSLIMSASFPHLPGHNNNNNNNNNNIETEQSYQTDVL